MIEMPAGQSETPYYSFLCHATSYRYNNRYSFHVAQPVTDTYAIKVFLQEGLLVLSRFRHLQLKVVDELILILALHERGQPGLELFEVHVIFRNTETTWGLGRDEDVGNHVNEAIGANAVC